MKNIPPIDPGAVKLLNRLMKSRTPAERVSLMINACKIDVKSDKGLTQTLKTVAKSRKRMNKYTPAQRKKLLARAMKTVRRGK